MNLADRENSRMKLPGMLKTLVARTSPSDAADTRSVPIKNIMMPNDGTAEEGLHLLVNKELPMKC